VPAIVVGTTCTASPWAPTCTATVGTHMHRIAVGTHKHRIVETLKWVESKVLPLIPQSICKRARWICAKEPSIFAKKPYEHAQKSPVYHQVGRTHGDAISCAKYMQKSAMNMRSKDVHVHKKALWISTQEPCISSSALNPRWCLFERDVHAKETFER